MLSLPITQKNNWQRTPIVLSLVVSSKTNGSLCDCGNRPTVDKNEKSDQF